MRKFAIAIIFLLGVVFILGQFSEMQTVWQTLQQGDLRFLILALGVQWIWTVNVAALYRAIYRILGVEENLYDLWRLSLAANFVNVVAPSGGVSGLAVMLAHAHKRQTSSARMALGATLYILFDYYALIIVLILGLAVLIRRGNLTPTEIGASFILIAIAGTLGTLIYLGTRSATALERALNFLARPVNWVAHWFRRTTTPYLSTQRAHEFAHEAADGLKEVRRQPGSLWLPLALALSSKALLICVLFLVFLAFGVPFSVGTLIAGFSLSYLFVIVSPTPSGIGVVEGMMTLILRSLNVPLSAGTVVTLAFRGFTFWLPLLMGLLVFRNIGKTRPVHMPELSCNQLQAGHTGLSSVCKNCHQDQPQVGDTGLPADKSCMNTLAPILTPPLNKTKISPFFAKFTQFCKKFVRPTPAIRPKN